MKFHIASAVLGAAIAGGTIGYTNLSPTEQSAAIKAIAASEGFRGSPYVDSTGNATLGYGTKLPITHAEAQMLLRSRMAAEVECIAKGWPPWKVAGAKVKEALADAGYALGCKGLLEFRKALAALAADDYATAASEFRASRWFEEEPHRVERVIATLHR